MALEKVQRTARRQFVSQTRTSALGVDTTSGDNRSQIMNALSEFATAGSAEANRQQRAEIETRKALGASRAASDLLVTERYREGITEDDALATQLSYNAVVGKHETMNAGNQFLEWYQQNPNASDEAINSKKAELYQPLFEKYGTDERSLKQISLQVQESQYNLVPVQARVKSEYTKQRNQEALQMEIGDFMSDPNVDVDAVVDSEIPDTAKALGVNEFEYKKSLMQKMFELAETGDSRLLDKLSKTSWSKDSALISKAKVAYDNYTNRENAIAIGDALGTIEIDNQSLSIPWQSVLNRVEALNKKFPNSVSAAKVSSMKKARDSAVVKQGINQELTMKTFSNLNNESGLPLELDGSYTPEEKNAFVKDIEGVFAKKTQELVDELGMSQNDANALMMKQRLDWSRVNRTKLPLLEQNLKGLISLNPEDYVDGQGLPEYATSGLGILRQMDAATMDIYFTSREDKVFASNLKKGMETRDDFSAFKRAYSIRQSPFKGTSEERTELRSEVDVQVRDKLDSPWYLELLGAKDVPDWQVSLIRSRVMDEADVNAYNGLLDPEENARQSIATIMKDYSPTFNGSLINVNRSVLASGIGIPSTDVDSYIEAFITSSKKSIDAEYGEEVDVEDLSLEFSPNDTFIIRYRGGEQLGGRFDYDALRVAGAKADTSKLEQLRKEAESRKANRARAIQGIENYRIN